MILDHTLREFLDIFNVDHAINAAVATLLQTVDMQGFNLFYWLNATLPENFCKHPKNVNYLEQFANDHRTLFDLISFIVMNLDDVLDKLDTRRMVKWIIPIAPVNETLQVHQNINLLNLSKRLCHDTDVTVPVNYDQLVDKLPIIKSRNATIFGNVLGICPIQVYYPTDMEKYPIQRGLLYNIFMKLGINMVDDTNELTVNVKTFINNIPSFINLELLNTITNELLMNESTASVLLMGMINAYTLISRKIQSRYDIAMESFESSIMEVLIKTYNIPEVPLNYNTSVDCPKIALCDADELETHIIVKVLTHYERFYINGTTTISSLKLCPLQVTYLITLFPFYKNNKLSIVDGTITCQPLLPQEHTPNMQGFSYLKRLIMFNNDFETFKNTIHLYSFNATDVLGYIEALYENRGFKCSVIIAELTNYHLNTNFNTMGMYNVISKLSNSDQHVIDIERPCRFEHGTVDPHHLVHTLLETNPPSLYIPTLNTATIDAALTKLDQVVTFQDKCWLATQTNFNCIPLIKYYRLKVDKRSDILLLLLYSSLPSNFKNLIWKVFPAKLQEFPNHVDMLMEVEPNPNPRHSTLPSHMDIGSLVHLDPGHVNCLSLLDYYKATKDPNILAVLNIKIAHNNNR